MPIFIPRIFVVHIRILERFLFSEKGFMVLEVLGVVGGWEAPVHVALEAEVKGCGEYVRV